MSTTAETDPDVLTEIICHQRVTVLRMVNGEGEPNGVALTHEPFLKQKSDPERGTAKRGLTFA